MDERLWICLWMVGGGGLGAVLGAAFGALTGLLFAQHGGAAGTRLARRIVEIFLDAAERQPSFTSRAALIGATDGFLFLGTLGLVAGALLGLSGRAANELLLPAVLGSTLLIGGAMLFGVLAYAIPYRFVELLSSFLGGSLGCLLTARLLGSDYGPIGLAPGMLIGVIVGRAARRYSPKFLAPRIGKTTAPPRSDGTTDLLDSPHLRSGSDAIRKSDAGDKP